LKEGGLDITLAYTEAEHIIPDTDSRQFLISSYVGYSVVVSSIAQYLHAGSKRHAYVRRRRGDQEDRIPEKTKTPDKIPEFIPEIPNKISEKMSKKTPDRTPDKIQDKIPDRTPDRDSTEAGNWNMNRV
jgi:hypothetical protein